jgi:hypothetical protein
MLMQAKVKKLVQKLSFVLLCAAVLCLSGCGDIRDLKVTSVEIENVALNGFRGVDVALAVGIDNPAFQVGLSEIKGSLKLSGKVLGRMTMDPFVLRARSAEVYHLKASLSIEQGVTLTEVLSLMDKQTLDKCLVDVSVVATLKGGVSKRLNFNDIPLTDLL